MATKTERRLRKIALRREKTEAAAAAENSATQEVDAEPSAPETASGAPMRGYPYELISEDEMYRGTGSEEYNSHDDINDDRVQEMGQVMAASSARMEELASPCDFRFDLQEAFEKLRIAAKHPSDENMQALQSTFSDLGQVTQILLSKNHTAEEAAVLIAAGMGVTKRTLDIDLKEANDGLRRVHNGHFLHIKQIFRRLSVVEGKRHALPSYAEDPEQPLPTPTILEELDGIQQSLQTLQERDNLTPYFNQLKKNLDKLVAEYNTFRTLAGPQLKRQQVTLARQGNEMEQMKREMKMKDQRIDELDAKVTSMVAEVAEIKALLAGRG